MCTPNRCVARSISVAQEPRPAGACDTCCNRIVEGQEWMNDYVHSLRQLKLRFWTLQCQERVKFGASDAVVLQDWLFPFQSCCTWLAESCEFPWYL